MAQGEETMATEATSEKDLELQRKQKEADATNAQRTGVGTRVFTGMTRGKGSQVISYENFDESKPDTLPQSLAQFSEVTGVTDEKKLLAYLITGYNDDLYKAASDPIAEFVDQSWPDDVQTQFRLVVRNYSRAANVSIEDAVNLIKPGIVASLAKPAAPATA